ncbi:B12-binding domain/radical SAM domain-containing protein [Bradyrhizobium japonicum]|uniref:B12-binding domain/radical SAM domain-containing protein n=1 Tax=Bradyrhizobium japonicum TaxID=375 RepID=UPI001BA5C529|nr:B12-binding domain/radical SAM domain-containing protein [Bradyrhizobium japonicum]MBR0764488.1 B12-binding domain/radical SAM domain-containing protein [Bradyrhizobium japonicum]
MILRALAISAPDRFFGAGGRFLKSPDPASLFNACRQAALNSSRAIGAWGESNWSGSRTERRKSVLLMNSWQEDEPKLDWLLQIIRPNLVLIGAMSLCLPGAIACGKRAKEYFGKDVCVVLGGWHPSESVFLDDHGNIQHHASSPVRQMASGEISKVFDIVVSGEAEQLTAWMGERVADLAARNIDPADLNKHLHGIEDVAGRWIVAWADGNRTEGVVGKRGGVERTRLVPSCEVFGIQSSFENFAGRLTAHVYSDVTNGCVYDCHFCSERRSNTFGSIKEGDPVQNLVRQMSAAVRVVAEDSLHKKASAFVEDSTLLAGSKVHLRALIRDLEQRNMDIRFGGQLTVDQILARADILKDLHAVGLDYLFIGVETPDPTSLGGMSKDTRSGHESWLVRIERVLEILAALKIGCGGAVLFGLGETHQARSALLAQLEAWRARYGAPHPISLNWAVQHPLKGRDDGANYKYSDWALQSEEWADAFADFGEASTIYPLRGRQPPVLSEVKEIKSRCTLALSKDPVPTNRSHSRAANLRSSVETSGHRFVDRSDFAIDPTRATA